MGRCKKRHESCKIRSYRSDQTTEGRIDSIIKKLQKVEILNINTEYSSEIWSQLAIDLFNVDKKKKPLVMGHLEP